VDPNIHVGTAGPVVFVEHQRDIVCRTRAECVAELGDLHASRTTMESLAHQIDYG